jgi:hypothetical protein
MTMSPFTIPVLIRFSLFMRMNQAQLEGMERIQNKNDKHFQRGTKEQSTSCRLSMYKVKINAVNVLPVSGITPNDRWLLL